MVSIPMRIAPKKKYPMGRSSQGHPTRNACCAPNEKKNIAVALPNSTKLIAGMGQRWVAGTRSMAKLSICSSMDAAGPRNLSRMSSRLTGVILPHHCVVRVRFRYCGNRRREA
jgi:hypothetical protein